MMPPLLFTALLLAAAPTDTAPQHELRGAIIAGYAAEPAAGSGVLMIVRKVDVTTDTGEHRTLYFIHGAPGIFLGAGSASYPAIGARCDFTLESMFVSNDAVASRGRPGDPKSDVITDARC